MLYLLAILATFGIGAFTARVAADRGRVAWPWVMLTIVASVLVWAATIVIPVMWQGDERVIAVPLVGLLVGPPAAAALVLLLVWRLPETIPRMRGARWPMLRLSTRQEAAGECNVSVDGGVLCIGELRIAAAALDELAVDGECLRIGGDGRTLTLMPTGKPRSAAENAKHCQALERRIRQLLDRPAP
ncbi:MAG TPA: hypothetical protein VGL86_16630 [Polyangia bacterium]|jgi:hypothetical protein